MTIIINELLNINSARLNLNLTSTQNHLSCFSLPTHMTFYSLSLMTLLHTNSPLDSIPLNLLRSFSSYFIEIITEIFHRSFISSIVPNSMKYLYIIPIKKNYS